MGAYPWVEVWSVSPVQWCREHSRWKSMEKRNLHSPQSRGSSLLRHSSSQRRAEPRRKANWTQRFRRPGSFLTCIRASGSLGALLGAETTGLACPVGSFMAPEQGIVVILLTELCAHGNYHFGYIINGTPNLSTKRKK